DRRTPPDGWVPCLWPEEVIQLLETKKVTHLSLDHDLGDDEHGTGYDVLTWLEETMFFDPEFPMPKVSIHSDNALAVIRMKSCLDGIHRRMKQNAELKK